LKLLARRQDEVFAIDMGKDPSKKPGSGVVFVVDDESMLLDLAEVVLKSAGFEVHTFRDPRRALAEYAASESPPGVVITDFAMGGMNGLDLMRECRRLHPEQKIILVSGTVNEAIYTEGEVKPDSFIGKPYDTDQLVNAVQELTND
jgi:DNA-binding NtrC family response regulator